LSLSADGSLLEFVSNPSNGTRVVDARLDHVWVLRTNSRPGPVEDPYRSVAGPALVTAGLSRNGSLTWILAVKRVSNARSTLTITGMKTETGHQVVKFTKSVRHQVGIGDLIPDASGRHILIVGWSAALHWFDVVQRHIVTIPNGNMSTFRPVSTAW
jgi:hypothetical protein